MTVCGLTAGRIPWPTGKRKGRGIRGRSIILYGALAEAVLRESAQAVAFWWGVGPDTVWKWRRALEILGTTNEGTHRLRRDYALKPAAAAAREKAHAKARDPGRREKIAAAKRGKPRPRHVVEAVIRAHKGKKASAETRRKMSETHKRRGTRVPNTGPPWTKWEDECVRTMSGDEAA